MSFTDADLPGFLELLRQHPEWRDAVRYELAGDWLRRAESVARKADQWEIEVNARFDKIEAVLDAAIDEMRRANELSAVRFVEMMERFAKSDELFAAINERFIEVDKRFDAVDERFDAVDERFDAVDKRFDGMDQRFDGMDQRFDGMDRRFDGMDQRFDGIDHRLDKMDIRFDRIDGRLDNLTGRMGNVEGGQYEDRYHAVSHLADRFGRLAVVSLGDVSEVLHAREADVISGQEFKTLASLDFLLRGRDGKGPDALIVYVALEVSMTVAASDIRRAAERAAVLRKAGLDARAFVGGRSMPSQLRPLADELAVTLLLDQDEAA